MEIFFVHRHVSIDFTLRVDKNFLEEFHCRMRRESRSETSELSLPDSAGCVLIFAGSVIHNAVLIELITCVPDDRLI